MCFAGAMECEAHGCRMISKSTLTTQSSAQILLVNDTMHRRYHAQLTPSLQTYDKVASNALVATIRMLFDLRPTIKVIIAGAIRNADTFESFRQACCKFKGILRTQPNADNHSAKPIHC